MSVIQWLATLNDRVFFWLHPDKLDKCRFSRCVADWDVSSCKFAEFSSKWRK
jgi:hypothetical protein